MSTQEIPKCISWKEPKEVRQAYRQYMRERESPLWQFMRWIMTIALIAVLIWSSHSHNKWGSLIIIALAHAGLWALHQVRTVYRINEKGICRESGTSRTRHQWKDIESYSIGPDFLVEGIEEITFNTKKRGLLNIGTTFSFAPQEIDKMRLKEILETYLPGKKVSPDSMEDDEPDEFMDEEGFNGVLQNQGRVLN